jgi:hypothetical protein
MSTVGGVCRRWPIGFASHEPASTMECGEVRMAGFETKRSVVSVAASVVEIRIAVTGCPAFATVSGPLQGSLYG